MLPGGASHFDWLIDRDGVSPLLSFRLWERVDLCRPPREGMRAERMGDHRRAYLEYEGEVSGGRGEVKRVAEGEAEIVRESEEGVEVRVRFGEREATWSGRPAPGGHPDEWVFHLAQEG